MPIFRLLYNGRCLNSSMTGVQRYASEMKHIMVAGEPAELIAPGLNWSTGVRGHAWEQFVLPRRINKKSDILISPANTGPISYARQVVVVHDMATFDVPQAFSLSFSLWYRTLLRSLLRRVQFIVTVSDFSKARIIKYFPEAADKIGVVPNGVYPRINSENEVRLNAEVRANSPYLLFVGSMDPRKNLLRLLSAWQKAKIGKYWTLCVVGGSNSRIFRSLSISDDLTRSVRFLGRVDDVQLHALYAQAEAVICPSIYEGFGLPPLEAINSGCRRILVSDIPVFREVLGSNVSYFNPFQEDDIARILNDLENNKLLRIDMETARAIVNRYSWAGARAKFENFLCDRFLQ